MLKMEFVILFMLKPMLFVMVWMLEFMMNLSEKFD